MIGRKLGYRELEKGLGNQCLVLFLSLALNAGREWEIGLKEQFLILEQRIHHIAIRKKVADVTEWVWGMCN